MKPLSITNYTLTTALGAGVAVNKAKLFAGQSELQRCDFAGISDLQTWIGEVDGVDATVLPSALATFDCRNNRLAWLGLQQDGFIAAVRSAVANYGSDRVGVFMGTSTSGIRQTEQAYEELQSRDGVEVLPQWYNYEGTHNCYSIAEFVRLALELKGVTVAVSTACSSSAKVFASAQRALQAGLCDAAVVGGVDSLCFTTLYGFHSLQLLSSDVCRPSDQSRAGLSIGEAAGFALLDRAESGQALCLLGYGESSDAYHMSSPHPEGEGALLAMRAALNSASLSPADVDYVNLHGTGTVANDLAESKAMVALFDTQLPCSSTKGWTGHTLGAAGIVEAIFSMNCIEENMIPGSLNTQSVDPAIQANILLDNRSLEVNHVMSNSFGFGGSNCSLLFGRLQD